MGGQVAARWPRGGRSSGSVVGWSSGWVAPRPGSRVAGGAGRPGSGVPLCGRVPGGWVAGCLGARVNCNALKTRIALTNGPK